MGREPRGACQECGAATYRCVCDRFDALGITNGAKARERRRRRDQLVTDGGEDDLKRPAWADDDPEGWERMKQRDALYGTVDVHNEVDLTPEMWAFVEDAEDPLIDVVDFLKHEYLLRVEGEEVYRTPGYESQRPTLTRERGGTMVTVEVDVPRDIYEEAVETTKQQNSPESMYERESTIDGKLIDLIGLDIRYYVEGEEVETGPVYPDEDSEA